MQSVRKTVRGFTLIELLVAISIISILSIVGFVSYQNVSLKAKDAKVKADIDAIKKAYETNYDPSANSGQGGYKALSDTDFASGKIPTPPGGGSYIAFLGPGSTDGSNSLPGQNINTNAAYKVCAPNTNACVSSNQGDTALVTQINSLSNPSCDPTGSLGLGLVGYWKMDDNVNDSSGNGNNGTFYGTGSHWVTGKFGNAGNFSNGNYTKVPDSAPLQLSNALTLSLWLNLGATPATWLEIAGKLKTDSNTALAYGLRRGGTNIFADFLVNGVRYTVTAENAPYLGANTWAHFAVTFDGLSIKTYKNGNPISQDTNAGGTIDSSAGKPFGIGMGAGYGDFVGLLDDVRLYNRVLSSTEVTALHNGCIP